MQNYSYEQIGTFYGFDVAIDPALEGGEWCVRTVLKPNVKKKTNIMKYYKVIKDNFLWETGGIIKSNSDGSGYVPVDDIYKKHDGNEYITADIIENSPEYFTRVYKVDLVTRVVFEVKDKAKELMTKQYSGGGAE